MRSAPTSFGLSYRIGMPVRVPGSSRTAWTPNHSSAISRNAAVNRGTTDDTAIPNWSGWKAIPFRRSKSATSRASSSEVRSPLVEIRQCCTSLGPSNSPSTVWVFPTSMVRSTLASGAELSGEIEAEVDDPGRSGDRPDGDEVGPGGGVVGDGGQRNATGHFDLHAPVHPFDGDGDLI